MTENAQSTPSASLVPFHKLPLVEQNRRNLLDIKDIFDKHGLTFWLFCGAFLGIYRGGDLIEYDHDLDLAVMMEDWDNYEKCMHDIEVIGFRNIPTHPDAKALKRGDAGIDFFFFKEDWSNRVWHHYNKILTEDFMNYNCIYWRGRYFRILRNPERWLSYLYGGDWRTPKKNMHTVTQVFGE